ncbi:hypothetical protein FB451DRAFT_414482 [Mycena latifolia]|nr:hypothetical protein FB451DRAFT_414482 [Mycena latifolia]
MNTKRTIRWRSPRAQQRPCAPRARMSPSRRRSRRRGARLPIRILTLILILMHTHTNSAECGDASVSVPDLRRVYGGARREERDLRRAENKNVEQGTVAMEPDGEATRALWAHASVFAARRAQTRTRTRTRTHSQLPPLPLRFCRPSEEDSLPLSLPASNSFFSESRFRALQYAGGWCRSAPAPRADSAIRPLTLFGRPMCASYAHFLLFFVLCYALLPVYSFDFLRFVLVSVIHTVLLRSYLSLHTFPCL